MAESGSASSEVEVKVVFKADTSELDEAKKSLGSLDSGSSGGNSGEGSSGPDGSGGSEGLKEAGAAAEEASKNLNELNENLEGTGEKLGGIGDAANDAADNLGDIGDAANDAADNLGDIGDAANDTADNLGNIGDAANNAAGNLGNIGASGRNAADGVEEIGDASSSSSGHLQTIIGLLEQIAERLNSMGGAADSARDEVRRTDEATRGSIDTFKDFSEALGKFENLGSSLKGFSSSLIAIGADAVNTAGEFEQLLAKLVTIQKSTETANETFEYAKTLAASTPFDVKGVVNAAVQLEVYGQSSKELLPVVANLASAMGGDLSAAATAFGRALSGSSEGLQSLRDSFGVNTDKLVKFGAALNKQGGIAVDSAANVEKLKKALVGLVNTEFAGGIERQAATIAGAMGNVEDEITNTKAAIGAEFAPYISVIGEQVSKLLEGMRGFAPVIAVVGGLAAATTGLAGTFITAAASAVGLGVAAKALHGDYERLSVAAAKLKAAHAGVFSKGMAAGVIGGYLAGAFMVYEGASMYLEKWIADEKKAQAEIAAQSRELVTQRQNWDDLRKSIEGATGAKVKFSANDTTKGAKSLAEISKETPGVMLKDALSKRGWSADKLLDEEKNREQNYKNALRKQQENQNLLDAYYEKVREINAAGYSQNPAKQAASILGIEPNELQKNKELFDKQVEIYKYYYDEILSINSKIKTDTGRIGSAIKSASVNETYLDFADKAKDADALYDAIERMRESLASLYEAGKGQTVLGDTQIKDTAARLERMGELMRTGQQDSSEFNLLKAITDQEEKLKEAYKTQKELRQQYLKDDEQAFNEQLSRERAGREQSLDEERIYWETLLEGRKHNRQAMALSYEEELRSRKNGFNPGEQERLQNEINNLQHLTPGEIEAINKLHEIDKKQAAESFNSLIAPLREAADELSSKVAAKPADQVAAWKLVVDKAKEWGQTNAEILAQSPELKKQYESDLKGIESEYKRVQEAAGSAVLTRLADRVSENIGSVSSPTAQLDAIREAERLYQQTLRASQELRNSEAAREQAQKQINSLKQQELRLTEQIKEAQKQAERETSSVQIQIEEERLAALQDRSGLGEDVSKQILAQEQKIQEMRLQMLEEAKKQELEKIVGSGEEAAKLRLATEEKYRSQTELLNLQHLRRMAQQQRNFDSQQDKNKNKFKDRDSLKNGESKVREESSWKPGSPLMSLQEALNKQNQWFASAGSDFMKDAAAKTNSMGGAAQSAAEKLLKLASSADSAASGLSNPGGTSAAAAKAKESANAAISAGAASAVSSAARLPVGMTMADIASAAPGNEYTAYMKDAIQDYKMGKHFPDADQFGSPVHMERIPDNISVTNSINNQRYNSTYNVSFNGQAYSGNAVAEQQAAFWVNNLVSQKLKGAARANSPLY